MADSWKEKLFGKFGIWAVTAVLGSTAGALVLAKAYGEDTQRTKVIAERTKSNESRITKMHEDSQKANKEQSEALQSGLEKVAEAMDVLKDVVAENGVQRQTLLVNQQHIMQEQREMRNEIKEVQSTQKDLQAGQKLSNHRLSDLERATVIFPGRAPKEDE